MRWGAVLLLLIPLHLSLAAQPPPAAPDFQIDDRLRSDVIDRVLGGLHKSYVLPDVAHEMEKAIREGVQKGEYESITSAAAFTKKLTADLQAVSRDKHLRVKLASAPPSDAPRPQRRDFREVVAEAARTDNAGFARIDVLPGNIGYVDLRMFYPAELAAEEAADAMNRVADTNALLIDLRQNGGGEPAMVALMVSYLLPPERLLVNTFVGRDGRVRRETWTTPDLRGKRYIGKDVYVLTSSYTFSAAEEFAYDLKNLKRATIVGETTGGGANPVDVFRIDDRFEVAIPVARAINPITKTNWEGVGVSPDVKVPAEAALATAHLAALKKQLERPADAATKELLERAIDQAQKKSDELLRNSSAG